MVHKNVSQGCNFIKRLEHNIKLASWDHTLSYEKLTNTIQTDIISTHAKLWFLKM